MWSIRVTAHVCMEGLNGATNLYYSIEACEEDQADTGNQEIMENVRISTDHLEIRNSLGEKIEDVVVFMESVEECQSECKSRNGKDKEGICGAWSYDKEEEDCYIHNVESCCGQRGKQEKNPSFVSGYRCTVCWSTKEGTDCPCSIEERNSATSFSGHTSGGARETTHLTSGALLEVQCTKSNPDPCACRRGKRKGKKKNTKRCLRPLCKHEDKNPNGTCEQAVRCRSRGKTLDELLEPSSVTKHCFN